MKNFILFIAVCFNSIPFSFSCGFSPYGEDVRFSLLFPGYFDYNSYQPFHYNNNAFWFPENQTEEYDANIHDWHKFTDEKVPLASIHYFMNHLKLTDISDQSTNDFVSYLYRNKLQHVIDYLVLAKKCEVFTGYDYQNNPWERETNQQATTTRSDYLRQLSEQCRKEKDRFLQRRYAFLIIRLAYYNNQPELIETYFDEYFKQSDTDFLYYWSLYFYCFTPGSTSSDVAKVMVNSPEKRYASYYYFHSKFSLKDALNTSKTDQDRANSYIFASIQKADKNLSNLTKIYSYDSRSEALGFLLLREINKLEDWIYTPYYSNYLPSTSMNWWEYNKETTLTLRNRSEQDRLYARQVLNFVNSVDLKTVKDPELWRSAQIQLLFMTRSYSECLQKISVFMKTYPSRKSVEQAEQIKALCLAARQTTGSAVLKEETKEIILKNFNNNRFLFALARELEYLGNLPDAAALMSSLNQNLWSDYSQSDQKKAVWWQGNRQKKSGNLKCFYNYFDYIDFVYSADELSRIVHNIKAISQQPLNQFDSLIYSTLIHESGYLGDLLGTKYIRENRLNDALAAFRSVDGTYWANNYNAWERDWFDGGYYAFDHNPFYDFKNTPDFIEKRENFLVTKISVTEHLIDFLKKAEDVNNPKRAYYYFLVANCYFNMSQCGNSWMMRRFQSTTWYINNEISYIDEREYRENHLAQNYYRLAYKYADNRKFKALCLRMEEYTYALSTEDEQHYDRLAKEYPEYYEDLSSCYNLDDYFKP